MLRRGLGPHRRSSMCTHSARRCRNQSRTPQCTWTSTRRQTESRHYRTPHSMIPGRFRILQYNLTFCMDSWSTPSRARSSRGRCIRLRWPCYYHRSPRLTPGSHLRKSMCNRWAERRRSQSRTPLYSLRSTRRQTLRCCHHTPHSWT